jgi:hypothetical protein
MLGGPFQGFTAPTFAARTRPEFRHLRAIADERDGKIRLHLPKGFHYRSFHDTESPVVLDDDTTLPGNHDGMGAFPKANGNVVLVRNHELNFPGAPFGPAAAAYDGMARGGTTTIEVTPQGVVVEAFTSLNGTQMNCSGGIMPWGSWITCEETVNGPDVGPDFTGTSNLALEERHGYIFEVPADGQSNRQPITKAGRFAHEAVAFDPDEGILYLTEDNFGFPSGLYRYIPPTNPMETGELADGGQLQMLAVKGKPNADLARHQRRRATYRVGWVDIAQPDTTFPAGTTNNQALVFVGNQGRAQGAAYFSRLEGAVWDNGVIYFCSTQGGGAAETSLGPIGNGFGNGTGQVWAYHTHSQTLQLIYEAPSATKLELPDNITASPRGTLILCEDGPADNYLRGLTRGGQLFEVALNRLRVGGDPEGASRFGDEFAGSTFSTDGGTLFVNIQATNGMTFAIWGPWTTLGV